MKKWMTPEVVVALSAALWGLFWLPLRALQEQGLAVDWLALSQFSVPLVCLLPLVLWRLAKGYPTGIRHVSTGLLIGGGFLLYCYSLLFTDVVRALVLFYFLPVWGTLIEVFYLKRRVVWQRVLALTLALAGLLSIITASPDQAISLNIGDMLALGSGILFAFGSARVRSSTLIPDLEQLFAFFFYGSVLAVFATFLPMPDRVPWDTQVVMALIPWLLVMAVVFLIPVMWGIYWGSRHVDPGRLGILLQLEALVGITSAALLAGEPFGWHEVIGATFILAAGIVEVFISPANRSN